MSCRRQKRVLTSIMRNTPIKLMATPDIGYRVSSWSGGTINDETTNNDNIVILWHDTHIIVSFEQPATLFTDDYTSIQATIDAAKNGDIVIINKPQNYVHGLEIDGKEFTLIGATDPTISRWRKCSRWLD